MIQTLSFSVTDPDESAAVGTAALRFELPFNFTIVGVSVCPLEDDTGATMDIQDDGTDVITAISCADKDAVTPWLSTHVGGTNTPVHVAADSEVTFDFNSAAVANIFHVAISFLAGVVNA